MSTIVTFGYIGAAPGKPGANPIYYTLLDDGESYSGTDLGLVANRSGYYWQGPLPGSVGYFAASPGAPMIVTLGRGYWPIWPLALPGYHRDDPTPPVFYGLGTSIRVSAAEAACLKHANALATW